MRQLFCVPQLVLHASVLKSSHKGDSALDANCR